MYSILFLLPSLFINTAEAKPHHTETPVRATLSDGQILMGEVHTKTLLLQSGAGLLQIPLEDVGEVVPASGGKLGEAEGRVDVWLRNGSELRGTWAEPKLAMSIRVGGADVPVDLPMNELLRFQLQGGTHWPAGPVYRMRTSAGDDFLVDPARTHLVVVNEFGTFEPSLAECKYVAPIDDPKGLWRVQLQTGTVLLGHLQDDKVTVALPMGPEEVSIPLDQFVSLRLESWQPIGNRVATATPPTPPDRAYQADQYPQESYEVPGSYGYYQPGSVDSSVAQPSPSYAASQELLTETVRRPARGTAARAKPEAQAPAAAAPVAEEEWFDSSDLAESKKAQE